MNLPAPVSSTSEQQRRDAPETTIRPRNRRTVAAGGSQELVSTSTATSTPPRSRGVSPLPSKHPSRSATRSNGRSVGGVVPAAEVSGGAGGRGSPQSFGGIWEGGWTNSWTAVQGLASSVLGLDTQSDTAADVTVNGSLAAARRAKKQKSPETWGPSGLPKKPQDVIGAGSVAERTAALRAMKMRGVLEGREEDLNVRKDTNGNYKRRTSVDDTTQGGLRDEEGDALVYIHPVRPQDTLAGVVLRYNCQPAVFRKANRLWPNDSIQIRKIVILPVDACTIKGRPCDPPSPSHRAVDLLAPTPEIEDPNSFNNGSTWPGLSSAQSTASTEQQGTEEHPWIHVRWVLLDSSPSAQPVEIARMPRHTLGYFPPRRRKSQATLSPASSRRGSSDFPSFSIPSNEPGGSPSSTASRRASNLGHRPTSGSYFPSSAPSSRNRGESVGEVAERMGWMKGPGGVGTFSKNVRKPGPAQDGLNSWARKHIPGLAIDSLPSVSLVGGESAHIGFTDEIAGLEDGPMRQMRSGTATPSGAGQGLGLENAAAAIEGWVRRLATIRPGTPRVGGGAESSDLIELLDGAGSDDGRGFELAPGTLTVPTPGMDGGSREDLNGLVRGRAMAVPKGGKGD